MFFHICTQNFCAYLHPLSAHTLTPESSAHTVSFYTTFTIEYWQIEEWRLKLAIEISFCSQWWGVAPENFTTTPHFSKTVFSHALVTFIKVLLYKSEACYVKNILEMLVICIIGIAWFFAFLELRFTFIKWGVECEWESGDWKWGRKVSGVTLHFSCSHSIVKVVLRWVHIGILWNYCHRFRCYFLFFQIFFVTYSDFIENNRFFCRVHHSLHSWILFNYVSTYQIRGSAFLLKFSLSFV